MNEISPSQGEVEEAKRTPSGWIYRINSRFHGRETVPPDAIIGAWQVNSAGEIIGEFKANPNYDAEKWKLD